MIGNTRLPSGMRILTEHIPEAISVSVGVWILRGSRSEPAEWVGVTHFIEHILFKGTETRSALDIAREIEAVGGSLNAFTGKELVCLYARVLHSQLPLALDLLSDLLLRATFPADEIEKERQVILQEISMIEDSPEEFVHELFSGSYWRDHPLGRPTLGTKEVVGRLDRESLVSYVRQIQEPSRILLTVAGNLEHDRVVRVAKKFFDFPSSESTEISLEKPVAHTGLNLHLKELEQAHLCLGTLGYPYSHERRYAYHVLNTLLGGGMSSRLFQEIREKRGLAYAVYSFQSSFCDSGLLGVYVGTACEALPEVINVLKEILSGLKNADVSDEELRVAKEQLKGNLLLSTESTSSRMSKMAMNEMYFGQQLEMNEVLGKIEQVRKSDVREISEDLFRSEHIGLTVLGDVDRDSFASMNLDL